MSQTLSPSFARCYGLARVARAWKISRASVYRSQADAAEHERPSPWSGRRMFGRGTGRPHPPVARSCEVFPNLLFAPPESSRITIGNFKFPGHQF